MSCDYPPYLHLLKVAEHCPKACFVYMLMWQKRNKNQTLRVIKSKVRDEYNTSLAKFRHDIFLLQKEGIILFSEDKKEIWIKFNPCISEVMIGKTLC